jgi:hypothetical protein
MDSIERKSYEAAIEEFFAKGGTVTQCALSERSENGAVNVWGKKKKKSKKEVD